MPKRNQKNKKQPPYLTRLIMRLAPRVGAKVVVEPEWKYAAQIVYGNGVVRSLRCYSMDLNTIASSDVAKDKDFAKFFIRKAGYPVAEGTTVFKDSWAKAIKSRRDIGYAVKYAQKRGFPIVAKPNSHSQGAGVAVAYSVKELKGILKSIFEIDKVAILERYLPGRDYRVVVLDGDVISAYERFPFSVTGDGKSSVLSLMKKKERHFRRSERDTRVDFSDPRIKEKLRRQGFSLRSVLPEAEQVFLLDNANLSSGGEASDVTKEIHPGFKKIAADITRKMGLRIAGVDIMLTKGELSKDPEACRYYIIEINAAPGLDHYVTTGAAQRRTVEGMYLKILKALGKKSILKG